MANMTYKLARRVVIAVVGVTVVLIGIVMLVAPGPGLIVIPAGLAILSLEFAWARYWLNRMRQGLSRRSAQDLGERAESHRDRVDPRDSNSR